MGVPITIKPTNTEAVYKPSNFSYYQANNKETGVSYYQANNKKSSQPACFFLVPQRKPALLTSQQG
jgi:hypothetical protein